MRVAIRFLCVLVLLFAASRGLAAMQQPNVLLITLDTTRSDRLGCYGYAKAATPNLDRLANQGLMFKNAFSSVPLTLPSHATIMTGFYPFRTGVRDNGLNKLPQSVDTLAEILSKHGYHTYAFVSAAVLDRAFGLDQGFEFYDDNLRVGSNAAQFEERTSAQLNQALRNNLGQIKAPYLLWIHYYDPHFPYAPPPAYDSADPYDGEIAFMDNSIGELLDNLRENKLMDNTMIVISGDHGEDLNDHGEKTHGVFLYRSTLQVPLIIQLPDGSHANQQISSLTRLVDLFPTILDYARVTIPGGIDGVSLRKAIETPQATVARENYEETIFTTDNYGWAPLFGIRNSEWHFILAPQRELYHSTVDPDERQNVFSKFSNTAKKMEEQLRRYPFAQAGAEPSNISPELKEQLQSLGYTSSQEHHNARTAIDPKDGRPVLQKMNEAQDSVAKGNCNAALPVLVSLLRGNPHNVQVRSILAYCYMRQEKFALAEEQYREALKDQPFAYLYIGLGKALVGQKKIVEGATSLRQALQLVPRSAEAYVALIQVQFESKNIPGAKNLMEEAIKAGIQDAYVFLLRGRIAASEEKYEEASGFFRNAIAQNPDFFDAYVDLGNVMFQEKNIPESVAAYEKAIALDPRDIPTLKTLASLYLYNMDDPRKARELFQRALTLDPDAADAEDLQELILELESFKE